MGIVRWAFYSLLIAHCHFLSNFQWNVKVCDFLKKIAMDRSVKHQVPPTLVLNKMTTNMHSFCHWFIAKRFFKWENHLSDSIPIFFFSTNSFYSLFQSYLCKGNKSCALSFRLYHHLKFCCRIQGFNVKLAIRVGNSLLTLT